MAPSMAMAQMAMASAQAATRTLTAPGSRGRAHATPTAGAELTKCMMERAKETEGQSENARKAALSFLQLNPAPPGRRGSAPKSPRSVRGRKTTSRVQAPFKTSGRQNSSDSGLDVLW